MKPLSILLVGCGNMGGALLKGWLSAKNPPKMTVIDRHFEGAQPADRTVYASLDQIPKNAHFDLIVLAVKPQYGTEIVQSLRKIMGANLDKSTLVSVMAGGTCAALAQASGNEDLPVIRIMPNTPYCVGAGACGVYASPSVSPDLLNRFLELMREIGTAVSVPKESDLRAVTAIAGSAVAYVFLLAELLEKEGEKLGLSPENAEQLARATVWGAGKMLHELPESAATLRRNVTSPGGTTAAALSVFTEPQNWPRTVEEACGACVKRAEELGG